MRSITINYMRIAMDADCLIKLAKAGLKEKVCAAWTVSIPVLVLQETVERAPRLPDAVRISENIAAGRLAVQAVGQDQAKGEDAVLGLYQGGGFDAVATDDARFIRRLRALGVPYALPAVIVVRLRLDGTLNADQAGQALAALRQHISADQHAAALLMLSGGIRP
jgi:rRNA-processing protein FCF1